MYPAEQATTTEGQLSVIPWPTGMAMDSIEMIEYGVCDDFLAD